MKTKKMIGAVALAAALAMGTALPAFAESATNDKAFSGTSGSTEIKASVADGNLMATVPLNVAIVFGSDGSSTITAPDASKYAITNTGSGDIKLSEATISDVKTGFTFDGIMTDNTDWYAASTKAVITSGNYIMLTFNDGTNNTYLSPSHPLSTALGKVGMTQNDSQLDANFKTFTSPTIAKNGQLNIQLGGKCYFTSTVDNSMLTDMLCKITYTIAKA